jgi:hypothetical protein
MNSDIDCWLALLDYIKPDTGREISTSYTCLMTAIAAGFTDGALRALDRGDVGAIVRREGEFKTALSLACDQIGHSMQSMTMLVPLICQRLGQGKIDLPPNYPGKAAIHWACRSMDPEVVRIMVGYGIDVNRLDGHRRTGLSALTSCKRQETIIEILEILTTCSTPLSLTGSNISITADFIKAEVSLPKVVRWLFEVGKVNPAEPCGEETESYVTVSSTLRQFMGNRGDPEWREIYEKYCSGYS